MLTVLSTLTNLQYLWLGFESRSRPDWASRRPPTRSLLPVLMYFSFNGVSEYLDNLMARIDAPRLKDLDITFFNQIVFDTPRLIQFIGRTPMLKLFEKTRVVFRDCAARVKISSQTPNYGELEVEILCRESDWQVSSLEQVRTSCLPPLSTLEDLYIDENSYSPPDWKDNIENTLWLGLLHHCEESLFIQENCATYRASPARARWGRTAEMLPTLQNIFVEFQPPRACPGKHWTFRCRATGHQSPYSYYLPGKKVERG